VASTTSSSVPLHFGGFPAHLKPWYAVLACAKAGLVLGLRGANRTRASSLPGTHIKAVVSDSSTAGTWLTTCAQAASMVALYLRGPTDDCQYKLSDGDS
jgi:hypothetical protein